MPHRFIPVICFFLSLCIWPDILPANASQDSLLNGYTADVKTLMSVRDRLEHTLQFGRSQSDIFKTPSTGQNNLLTRDQKLVLWGMWSNILDYTITMDGLRGKYKDFSALKNKKDESRGFDVAECAFMTQYRYAMEFISLASQNPAVDVILNDAVSEMGLPRDTFKEFKFRFLNAARAVEFASFQVLEKRYGLGEMDLRVACTHDSDAILRMGKTTGQVLTLKNALDIIKKGAFSVWFPVQKSVSSWMGDVRVRRNDTALISNQQIKDMISSLEPGDILLERREWYLSNLGLPGFWTHAALIAGTTEERSAWFDDPAVHKWVREQGVQSGEFNDLLRTKYPDAYALANKTDNTGHLPRVLEAVSEGVVFTAFEHTAAADSFVILRPRLSKLEKAIALLKGFQYSGRPYDFNFDFLTDSELVCSELAYKVYEPAKDTAGIKFATDKILDRTMTIPNGIARQFDEEYGKAGQQMDLVVFLDGYERSGKALDAGLDAFRTTWKRPKWHIVFQETLDQ